MKTKLHLIMTSDTHAHWLNRPDDMEHSLLNTATAIKELQKKLSERNEPYITIDLGDFIQGSSFATYLNQEAIDGSVLARAMNEIGYDYQIIGNHEFNFGEDYRNNILSELNAQILAANIIDEETGQPALGDPYIVTNIEGIKVGIIGITTHYIPNWELPERYRGLRFEDAFETAQKYVSELRPNVDVIVVAYHGGFERNLNSYDPLEELTGENQGSKMLKEIDGIDVLLTGHQHRQITQQVGHAFTAQPGYAGEKIAHITVEIDTNQIVNISGDLIDTNSYASSSQVEEVMQPEIINGHDWLTEVVGRAPLKSVTNNEHEARMTGHPYIELLNEIQLKETGAQFSAVTLINDTFQYFTGNITNEILLKSYPFFNLIATVKVTGADLYEIMEYNFEYYALNDNNEVIVNPEYLNPKPRHYNFDLYSGLKAVVDITQPEGERIKDLIDESTGTSINVEQTYSLAVSQYRAVGGGNFKWFTPEKIQQISAHDIATLLKEAVKTFDARDWREINSNYRHIVWQPKVTLADKPLGK